MNSLSARPAPTPRTPVPRDSALRCLAPGEGARMCEQFTNWVMTQPDLAPKFTSVSRRSFSVCAPAEHQMRLSKACLSPTFTSIVTASSPNALSVSSATPMSVSESPEPFNVLGLLTLNDDVVIEDFDAL